jgi:hypothetical protein
MAKEVVFPGESPDYRAARERLLQLEIDGAALEPVRRPDWDEQLHYD